MPTEEDWLGGGGGGGGSGSGQDIFPPENTTFPDSVILQGALFPADTSSMPTPPPTCDTASRAKWRPVDAWCRGSTVSPARMTLLRNAVSRIRLHGISHCDDLANLLDRALDSAATEVRTFSQSTTVNGQMIYKGMRAGSQASGTWLAISEEFIDNFHTTPERIADVVSGKWLLFNLEDILVHEADHLDGWSDPAPHTTSSSIATCGSNAPF